MNDGDFEQKVILIDENVRLKEKIVELKCIITERDRILDVVYDYVDTENPGDRSATSHFIEAIMKMIECRTAIKFSLIDRGVVKQHDEDNSIEKRLNSIDGMNAF